MGTGLLGLKSETYGCATSEIRPMGMKCEGIRSF